LKHFDYLVVGHGLAGCLLAWFLEKENKKVLVIDGNDPSSSSRIAAGIIHPVTGRRIVKSWMADQLIPFAVDTYSKIGEQFKSLFFHPASILEIYPSIKHRNDWLIRSAEQGMAGYLGEEIQPGSIPGIRLPLGGIIVKQGGYLLTDELLKCHRQHLNNHDCFYEGHFRYEDLIIENESVRWKDVRATGIIFCEGAAALKNQFFPHLPFVPSKGEILTMEAPLLAQQYILNRSIYVLPVGNHIFRVGATHEWNRLDNVPTGDAREKIIRLLHEMIDVPFCITDHKAAIRPTVSDRRPFLGVNPDNKNIFIFNGLGTKGVMLGPWFANQMAGFLLNKNQPDKEVNISRFSGSLL